MDTGENITSLAEVKTMKLEVKKKLLHSFVQIIVPKSLKCHLKLF